jgi:cytoskeletal protein RodZ
VSEENKRETAEAFIRSIEVELAGKRARRKRDRERRQAIRLISFSFLSLVILGALLALWFTFSRANEVRSERRPSPSSSASASPRP